MTEDHIILKPYSPAFNDAISTLHKECGAITGSEFPNNSIRISLNFPQGYDKFLRLNDSFICYLLWDTDLDKPIAIITGTLKSLYLHGKLRKIGIITDLKQLPDYEEYTPAKQLFTKLESDFKESGVDYILIYYPNIISNILGESQLRDYDLASIRMIKSLSTDNSFPSTSLTKLSPESALAITSQHYNSHDFLPSDLNRIFLSEYYLGTYSLSNENGTMGISAWCPSDYCSTTVSEVYWPIRSRDQAYTIFKRILLLYILFTYIYIASGTWIYHQIPEQMLKLCYFVLALYVLVKISIIAYSILEYLRICYLDKTRKVTLFGFYSTCKEFDNSLFTNLISSLQSLLKSSGFSILQLNFDSEHDSVFTEIMQFSHEKQVLHRSLTGLHTYRTVVESFLDPRDVL